MRFCSGTGVEGLLEGCVHLGREVRVGAKERVCSQGNLPLIKANVVEALESPHERNDGVAENCAVENCSNLGLDNLSLL